MLGNSRENMHRQTVRLREVASDEVHASLHQRANEMHVAGETVQLGDHQRRLMQSAEPQRLSNRRTVVPLAALYLYDLLDELPVSAVEVALYRLTLRLQA